jgi:hypothetical protein
LIMNRLMMPLSLYRTFYFLRLPFVFGFLYLLAYH